MKFWFDDVKDELLKKYGEKSGEKLFYLLSDLIDEAEVYSVNQIIGNLLDRDYKGDYR